MAPLTSSLQTRASLYSLALVVMILGMAALATGSMTAINKKAQEIDHKWLAGTRAMGDLSDHISEFRIAEMTRIAAPEAVSRERAEVAASAHRRAVQSLLREYVALTKDSNLLDGVKAFRKAWDSYQEAVLVSRRQDLHGLSDGQTLRDVQTEGLYAATEAAVNHLIDQNEAAARAETLAADRLANSSVAAMFLASAASILLAAWILGRIRSQITAPLGAITEALSRLAAGDCDIVVPELHRPDEIGELAKAFDIFRANAIKSEEAHKETQKVKQLALFQARHDLLTGLPNRRFFAEEMQVAEAKLRDAAASCAVLLIDLDGFKAVNDLRGHYAGDQVLCEIARRLGKAVEKNDFLARLGGDEFAIIKTFEGAADRSQVSAAAEKLLAAVRLPIALGAQSVEIDGSIGIALCAKEGWDADMALRAADIAMYCAKREVRGAYRYFEPSMDIELRVRQVA